MTEKTPLKGDIIGINIFGRTGNYGHIILKRHNKQKKKIYQEGEMFDDGLPRLILVSGRSEAGVTQVVKMVSFDSTKYFSVVVRLSLKYR